MYPKWTENADKSYQKLNIELFCIDFKKNKIFIELSRCLIWNVHNNPFN